MTKRLSTLHLVATVHVLHHQARTVLRSGRRDAGITTVEWLIILVGVVSVATVVVALYKVVIERWSSQL